MDYISDIKILFRLQTIQVKWQSAVESLIPLNNLQKIANNYSNIISIELVSSTEFKIQFDDNQTYQFDATKYK